MKSLQPKRKVSLFTKEKCLNNLDLTKLKKRKWNLLKSTIRNKRIQIRPDQKKYRSRYKVELKQKIKYFYGAILTYQLKNIYKKFSKNKNSVNKTEDFLLHLESRLNTVVYRLNFGRSIFHCDQYIRDGVFSVNGKKITSKNYHLKPGDIISLNKRNVKVYQRKIPKHLEINSKLKMGVFIQKPQHISDLYFPFYMDFQTLSEILTK